MQHKSGVQKADNHCFNLFLLRCLQERMFLLPSPHPECKWLVRALQALGDPQIRFKPSCSLQCFIRWRTSFSPCSLPQFVEVTGVLIWHLGNYHSWDPYFEISFVFSWTVQSGRLLSCKIVCVHTKMLSSFHLVNVTGCSYTTCIENGRNHVHSILVSFDKNPVFIYQFNFFFW